MEQYRCLALNHKERIHEILRDEDRQSGDRPSWASLNLGDEDDVLLSRRWSVVCVVEEKPHVPVGGDWINEPSS
ncbi:hypothetical protein HAX54_007710 [Datura stramonium]|uniref:Uncharacterized protein n=1 Tax=Datura stramonium TaxID=4076 RepID=A0ABS8TDN9_DATST|nr:hypothetical protein [Datura stramonium]